MRIVVSADRTVRWSRDDVLFAMLGKLLIEQIVSFILDYFDELPLSNSAVIIDMVAL